MEVDSIAIVGVGLIGASLGAAVLSKGVARRVVGYDSIPEHLDTALRNRCLSHISNRFEDAVSEVDLVIICTPVNLIAEQVALASRFVKPSAAITDVGSTKGKIVEEVERFVPHARFVGSHPMAGSEKKGPDFAKSDLFEGRPLILTPTQLTKESITNQVSQFWTRLGCRVVRMTPIEHDHAVAAVSHLPHAVSAALAGCTKIELVPVTAGGWRDTTRVAAAGAGIWTPIFRENRVAVLSAIDRFTDHLAGFRRLIEADDGPGITAWLADAKRVRDALGS